jgi:hypothetical protein
MKEIIYDGNKNNFTIDGAETYSTNAQEPSNTKYFATKLIDKFLNFPFSVFIIVIILYYIMNTSIFLDNFYKDDIGFDSNLTNIGHIKFGFHFATATSFLYYIYQLLG